MGAYQPGTPTGTVDLDVDYQNLQNNFSQLDVQFGIDHIPFSNNSGTPPGGINGYHQAIHFNPVSTTVTNAPNNNPINGYTATGGYGQIFSAQLNDNISSDESLFFLSGGNRLTQFTRNFTPTVSTNGATFLPGGLIINWGQATKTTGGSVSFVQPFSSAVFSIVVTPLENNNNRHFVFVKSTSTTDFIVASRDSSGGDESNTFSWIAIGF